MADANSPLDETDPAVPSDFATRGFMRGDDRSSTPESFDVSASYPTAPFPSAPNPSASYDDGNSDSYADRDSADGPDLGYKRNSELPPQHEYRSRTRRLRTPIVLFVLTCLATFWVGAADWMPGQIIAASLERGSLLPLRHALITHWGQGLTYMVCVLSILMAHEMGHFAATVVYRIRASLPYFLPFPFNPIGTFGAVITMDASRADRKQIFDIGIAGPLAGLVLAVPIMWYGVATLDLTQEGYGGIRFYLPLAVQWMMDFYQPTGYSPGDGIWISQLNPFFMAGWVGLLVTGLNMLPVSQLDGGHITYTLFGKLAHWLARAFMVGGIAYMVYSENQALILMVVLIVLIGTDHPPTRNDHVPLGWFRTILGLASLSIPVLCFPPQVMEVITSTSM